MGLQLGPGFLRRRPRGWLGAQVSAVAHRSWVPASIGPDGSGQGELDTACRLDARWRVELPGREPYEFDEERRTAPTWVLGGAGFGAGNRWYKVRLRPTLGLIDGIAFPCFVDPSDPQRLWIDWDAAHEAHVPVWGRQARVERELARRENPWEYALERVMNPFAGRLQEGEQELAERTHVERKAAQAEEERRMREQAERRLAEQGWTSDPEVAAELRAAADRLKHIHDTGRKTTATVVARRETGRRIGPVAVVEIVFDLEDGGTSRRVVHEHLFGPRGAKHYKPGRKVAAWIDAVDPDAICPGR